MTSTHKNTTAGVVVASLALLGWAAVSSADLQDAELAHRVHCEAVAEWQADKAAGLGEYDRRGWPNYDNRECGQ